MEKKKERIERKEREDRAGASFTPFQCFCGEITQSENATEKSSKRCDIYVLASGSTRKGRYGIDQKKKG